MHYCARCEELQAELKQLKLDMGYSHEDYNLVRNTYKLTKQETEMLMLLYKGKGRTLSIEYILAMISDTERDPALIRVVKNRVNHKFLRVHKQGSKPIEAIWGVGLKCTQYALDQIDNLLA